MTLDGECSIFVELPGDSVGNGIRFNRRGDMFIADYVNHNVFKVDMATRKLSVHAHEPRMNQPNDLAIGADDVLYASDPNWSETTGQVWRIDPDGKTALLLADMGTTNGIEVAPNEKTLYVSESRQRNIFAFDITADHTLTNKRLFISFRRHALRHGRQPLRNAHRRRNRGCYFTERPGTAQRTTQRQKLQQHRLRRTGRAHVLRYHGGSRKH